MNPSPELIYALMLAFAAVTGGYGLAKRMSNNARRRHLQQQAQRRQGGRGPKAGA